MPLQNRVTPFGEIVAFPERGALMGNRGGCLCIRPGVLGGRRWVSRRWILCETEFRGWRREVMQVGQYTELFFLDEPTGLAAGHRPCAFCRPEAFRRFKAAWLAGNPDEGLSATASIDAIDRVLHGQRLGDRERLELGAVPAGAMFVSPLDPSKALLQTGGRAMEWRPGGYSAGLALSPDEPVEVLTPRSTVNALRAGYRTGWRP